MKKIGLIALILVGFLCLTACGPSVKDQVEATMSQAAEIASSAMEGAGNVVASAIDGAASAGKDIVEAANSAASSTVDAAGVLDAASDLTEAANAANAQAAAGGTVDPQTIADSLDAAAGLMEAVQ